MNRMVVTVMRFFAGGWWRNPLQTSVTDDLANRLAQPATLKGQLNAS